MATQTKPTEQPRTPAGWIALSALGGARICLLVVYVLSRML
jgi:hypothetical protein